jgi:hypothetical protein
MLAVRVEAELQRKQRLIDQRMAQGAKPKPAIRSR